MKTSVVNLIIQIRERPTMFITRSSISCLKAYIDGWFFRNPQGVSDDYIIEQFQSWIAAKYKITTGHSWCDILLFYSGDEHLALQKFFLEFDDFLNEIEFLDTF